MVNLNADAISQNRSIVVLETLPDLESNDNFTAFAESHAKWINTWRPCLKELDTFRPLYPPPTPTISSSFGRWSDPLWRKFVCATLICDWACYPTPVDRADFSRLLFTMDRYPLGFRTWCIQSSERGWIPVGYTGFFPIDEFTYRRLEQQAHLLEDRAILPLRTTTLNPKIYIFNFSIIPALHRTIYAGHLIAELFKDIANIQPSGLAAITVSEDGVRIAQRLGLRKVGELILDGSCEIVFAASCFKLFLSKI